MGHDKQEKRLFKRVGDYFMSELERQASKKILEEWIKGLNPDIVLKFPEPAGEYFNHGIQPLVISYGDKEVRWDILEEDLEDLPADPCIQSRTKAQLITKVHSLISQETFREAKALLQIEEMINQLGYKGATFEAALYFDPPVWSIYFLRIIFQEESGNGIEESLLELPGKFVIFRWTTNLPKFYLFLGKILEVRLLLKNASKEISEKNTFLISRYQTKILGNFPRENPLELIGSDRCKDYYTNKMERPYYLVEYALWIEGGSRPTFEWEEKLMTLKPPFRYVYEAVNHHFNTNLHADPSSPYIQFIMPITYAQIQTLSVEEKQITIHIERSEYCPNYKTLTVAYVFRRQVKPLVSDQKEIEESGDIKINLPDFPDSGNVSLLLDRLSIDKWDWRPLREETSQIIGMPEKTKKMGKKVEDIWDQFEKIEELGKGGQGVVFKAKNKSSGQVVAIKRIKIQNPQKLQRARREIEALQRIDHENVIKILYFKEDPPSNPFYMWIGLEFAIYGNLSNNDAMRGEPLLALKIFKQICSGVKAVHKEAIIHRDLKPENILFINSLRIPKISDFGICFLKDLAEDTRITRTTETVGPKDFTAPELECWKPDIEDISPPADIYSLGKILYYMLEGRIIKREKFELTGQKYGIPELDTILQRTICEDPRERFQTVEELEEKIEKILTKYNKPYDSGIAEGQAVEKD